MTTQGYLRILREQWVVVSLVLALGVGGALSVYFFRPAEYTANLTMYVSAQSGDTTSAAFQGAQLSQDRVKSYTELVANTRVSQDVINKLGLQETPEQLSDQIRATSALDSVIIDVAVTDPSASRSATIANTVGQVFTALVAELERPIQPGGTPVVAVRVVQAAAIPSTPSSTGLPVLLALGLLAGLALGLASALGRNALDTSVKSPGDLAAITGAPNLGIIAHNSQVPKRPLTIHEDPQSSRSEAFRQLRTNIQFVDVDHPPRVIVVTSPMPSEGKTTTLVNLAISLASAGSRVLVVDGDLRRPRVTDLLGLERTVGLSNVLSGGVHAGQALQPWGGGMFDVIASGPLPPNPSELLASQNMSTFLQEMRKCYDVILVDTPPLLPVTDAAAVAPATDGVILICRFKATSKQQLASASDALKSVSAPILGTIFTMTPSRGPQAYAQYGSYYRTKTTSADDLAAKSDNGSNSRTKSSANTAAFRRPSPTTRKQR